MDQNQASQVAVDQLDAMDVVAVARSASVSELRALERDLQTRIGMCGRLTAGRSSREAIPYLMRCMSEHQKVAGMVRWVDEIEHIARLVRHFTRDPSMIDRCTRQDAARIAGALGRDDLRRPFDGVISVATTDSRAELDWLGPLIEYLQDGKRAREIKAGVALAHAMNATLASRT